MDEHGRKLGYTWIQLEYCIRIHCIRIWGARIQGGLHIFSYTKRIVLWEFEGPWNRFAKFLNDCLYVKFAIPLCGIFFVEWPLMVLWDEIGLCRKTIFQALCFFRTASQTSPALQKNNCSVSNKLFFVCLLSNLPTPPRNLALARSKMRKCIQYRIRTKNALRIWGTLDLLWWKFDCI